MTSHATGFIITITSHSETMNEKLHPEQVKFIVGAALEGYKTRKALTPLPLLEGVDFTI